MLKSAQGKVDLFGDLDGDLKHIWGKIGENRVNNTIAYWTPSFSGFKVGGQWVADESTDDATQGFSVSAAYGDVKYKKMPYFVSLAYDSEVKSRDTFRITAGGKVAGFKLGAMYQASEASEGEKDKLDGYFVSVGYSINKQWFVKGQVQGAESVSYTHLTLPTTPYV